MARSISLALVKSVPFWWRKPGRKSNFKLGCADRDEQNEQWMTIFPTK